MNIKEAILSATNFGLDVIIRYYPQAAEALSQKKNFKIREDERTASTSIKLFDNCYWIKDFGSDVSLSCFDIVMQFNRCTFSEALSIIIKDFNIHGLESHAKVYEPIIESRAAAEDEKEGETYFDIKEQFSIADLKEIFAQKVYEKFKTDTLKLEEVCNRYNMFSLFSYTRIKNRKATVIKSTGDYPIFLYDHTEFKKIYQPKASDKAFRFFYVGKKTENFIFGLKQLEKAYAKHKADLESEESDSVEGSRQKRNPKLKQAFFSSGERDGLNVNALSKENHILCLNSESAKLPEKVYLKILEMVDNLYNVPDIDSTGLFQGHQFAMDHLEVKTIWLPNELTTMVDFRGNKGKDVRNYLDRYSINSFYDLIKIALPYRFWNVRPKFDKNGIFKENEYVFNNLHSYNFLFRNGFCRFRNKNEEEGYMFTKVTGDVVKEVKASDIKDYINDFLENIKAETELRNMVYNTTRVKEQSMGNLPYREIEFKDFDKDSQFMFFLNKTWKISKHGIDEFKPGMVKRYTWDDEVIKHEVDKLDDFFNVQYDKETGKYSINILNKECKFFRFLINTANMHWRVTEHGVKELDKNGHEIHRKELTKDEAYENDMHLINRLYAFGYLLFRYKSPSKAWCVYAMENKIIEESASNGGSGKSLFMNAPFYFMKSQKLNGRDKDLITNKHWSEKITEHTDYVHLEDAHEYLDLEFFFNMITGDFPVNPKHAPSYDLSFDESPKMGISSNYPIKKPNQSTLRRILYTVFSDYYHHGPNDEFESSRTPKDDFGIELFRDFTEADWNHVINLIAQCIRLTLTFDKIEPPMQNVLQRNLIGEMGETFLDWAEVYFSKDSGRLNTHIVKEHAFNDFTTATKNKFMTANKFKTAMNRFCKYKEYELNPHDLLNDGSRIIGTIFDENLRKNKSVEMLHIRTNESKVYSATEFDTEFNNDKLPF